MKPTPSLRARWLDFCEECLGQWKRCKICTKDDDSDPDTFGDPDLAGDGPSTGGVLQDAGYDLLHCADHFALLGALHQIRAPQPKQYCQCCHRQFRRFFVCAGCGRRCCVQDCLAIHAYANYCVECVPPPHLQPAHPDDLLLRGTSTLRERKVALASMPRRYPFVRRHQCAICEAHNQWLYLCEDPSCLLMVCTDCIGDVPNHPGVQRCVWCLHRNA